MWGWEMRLDVSEFGRADCESGHSFVFGPHEIPLPTAVLGTLFAPILPRECQSIAILGSIDEQESG
jgi:hypothetical protein